jgi:hypothetical protein
MGNRGFSCPVVMIPVIACESSSTAAPLLGLMFEESLHFDTFRAHFNSFC